MLVENQWEHGCMLTNYYTATISNTVFLKRLLNLPWGFNMTIQLMPYEEKLPLIPRMGSNTEEESQPSV
jgi:hypothetical protein